MLIRSAFSANIKERRDCSTALFDEHGRMIAQAEHIPVHLGALPDAVAAVRDHDPGPDDVFVLNDPYTGGTHLPDITLVSRTPVGFAATRAHHADVGAVEPGSLPATSRSLDEEGIVIPPTRLDRATLDSLTGRMRNPDERRGDLRAQLAANRMATRRLEELCARRGRDLVVAAMDELHDYAERRVRAAIAELPDGRYESSDVLEAAEGDLGLRGNRAPTRRQPELPARGHAVGLLLRRALPDRPRCTRLGRRLRSGHGACAGRIACQRRPTRRGRRRQRRNLQPHRRRRLRRLRRGDRRAGPGPGIDEQRDARQQPLHLLRDDRRRPGRLPGRRRAVRRARRDVEHALDADGGARARLPDPGRATRPAPRLRRRGPASRRRRRRPRAARPRRLPPVDRQRAAAARTSPAAGPAEPVATC